MQTDSDAQRKAIEEYKICPNRSSDLKNHNCTKKAKPGFYLTDFIKEPFQLTPLLKKSGKVGYFKNIHSLSAA